MQRRMAPMACQSQRDRQAGFADIRWPRDPVIYATRVTLTRRLITLSYQMSEGFCRQGLSMTLLQVQILPIGKEQLTTSSPTHYLQHSLHEHRAPHVPKVPRKGHVTGPATQQWRHINQRRHHWPRILLTPGSDSEQIPSWLSAT